MPLLAYGSQPDRRVRRFPPPRSAGAEVARRGVRVYRPRR